MKKAKYLWLAVLLAAILMMSACQSSDLIGALTPTKTVVSTENYEVDTAMMSYFFVTQFNSYFQYYNQMYESYFKYSGTDGSAYDLMGIDPSKSLKDQYIKGADGEEPISVFDYYIDLTEDYVTRMLTYCEFATKQGIELTDDDMASIDKSIENLKSSYESQKALYAQFGMTYYASFSSFLVGFYGKGVSEEDVRKCLELVTLADKFEEKLNDEKRAQLLCDPTLADIEQYVKDNPAQFLIADYYAYSLIVSSMNYDSDAGFEVAKMEALEQAKRIAQVQGKDAYQAAVLELLKEAEKADYIEKNWASFLKENDGDDAKTQEAIEKTFNEKIWTEAMQTDKFAATLKVGYAYPTTPTDLSMWVYGTPENAYSDQAKVGDVIYLEDTKITEETVTTESGTQKIKVTEYIVTVYLLDKAAYRNTEITKNFGYVMFAEKKDAEAFYAEYSKGEMNKDTLVQVVNQMCEDDSTLSLHAYDALDNYLLGDLQDHGVAYADAWLVQARPGTCSGVIEVVKTTETTGLDNKTKQTMTTYYAILVYDKDGYEAWFCDALSGATNEAVADWYETNKLDVAYDKQAYSLIDISLS